MQAWDGFADFLKAHLAFENEYILPGAEALQLKLRWGILVYSKEHEKLLAMLSDIHAALCHYHGLQGRERRLGLLSLLEREQSLYHVMEHHEQREEQDLFLHLDQFGEKLKQEWQRREEKLFLRYQTVKEQLKYFLQSS